MSSIVGEEMYQKIYPAELDSLYEMLEFIDKFCTDLQMSARGLEQIHLAAEEALVNIISYGYPDEKRGTIEISCEKTTPEEEIKLTIKDQGIPFNPIEKAPATPPIAKSLDDNSNSLGGYGITILIGLMDRVEYQRLKDGNRLILIKNLHKESI